MQRNLSLTCENINCVIEYINYSPGRFRRLGIPLMNFKCAAREPTHNNGCCPLSKKV